MVEPLLFPAALGTLLTLLLQFTKNNFNFTGRERRIAAIVLSVAGGLIAYAINERPELEQLVIAALTVLATSQTIYNLLVKPIAG